MSRLRRLAVLGAVGALLAVTGCSDGESGDDASTTTARPELSSYADIAELDAALDEAGFTCELEYEGLEDEVREASRCVIDDQQVSLNIWHQEDFGIELLTESPDEDRVAVGQNWTVDTSTPELAVEIADALGGVVPSETSAFAPTDTESTTG